MCSSLCYESLAKLLLGLKQTGNLIILFSSTYENCSPVVNLAAFEGCRAVLKRILKCDLFLSTIIIPVYVS